jgi:hypothetical protein
MVAGVINIPPDLTIQGAGMWYTTLVGNPIEYTNSSLRVSLNGTGSNIRLSDFAIVGKLNYRNDSEPNDGLVGSYGAGSTISRVWVEHTKTGAWIINSKGLIVDSCRFRDTIADGINLCVGMQSTIVTNCSTRGTGDDCFPIWPATYTQQSYVPGSNLITHCTGELPFLANGGAIYGGTGNVIQDCLFQDITYGCGVLISTTFPVGGNVFRGTNAVQRCDLIRCGEDDSSGSALQICMNPAGITGIEISNVNIVDSISDGMSIIAPAGSSIQGGLGTLSNTTMTSVSIPNYGLGGIGENGLWVMGGTVGGITISNSMVAEYQNDSANFTIKFAPPALTITTTPSNAVVLSWPSIYTSYLLQTNSNLTTTDWHSAKYPNSSSGGVNSVLVPLPTRTLFFRLWDSAQGELDP